MTGIKICGLFREEDIDSANAVQPDYIGFILHFPKSHRNVSVETAARLKAQLHPGIRAVGVFVNQSEDTVVESAKTIGLDVIQLHGSEDDRYIDSIRRRTGLPVWKAFRVKSREDLAAVEASAADLVLLDGGSGGGEVFDWSLTQGIRRPFILAGGLTPENIPEAVRRLSPVLIDLSSGVETDRIKDRAKMRAAVEAVRDFG